MSHDLSNSALYLQAELGKAWQEHRPKLLRMLERRIGPDQRSRYDPEDVLSEASMVALKRWPEFCRTRPISTYAWLYRITWDALIEAWRREHRKLCNQKLDVAFPDRSSIQIGLRLMDSGTMPEDVLAREELKEQIRRAVDELPDQQREVLNLHFFDEMPVQEVADTLGISGRTVYREIEQSMHRLTPILRQFQPKGGRP